jgi:hypothetical protein
MFLTIRNLFLQREERRGELELNFLEAPVDCQLSIKLSNVLGQGDLNYVWEPNLLFIMSGQSDIDI